MKEYPLDSRCCGTCGKILVEDNYEVEVEESEEDEQILKFPSETEDPNEEEGSDDYKIDSQLIFDAEIDSSTMEFERKDKEIRELREKKRELEEELEVTMELLAKKKKNSM